MDPALGSELIRNACLTNAAQSGVRRRLFAAIKQLILEAALPPGTPLPPSRQLAAELGISRGTVVRAYEQLAIEGYLVGQAGSATRVSEALPVAATRHLRPAAGERADHGQLSRRGQALVEQPTSSRVQGGAFVPGVPDVGLFPFATWRRLLAKNVRYEQRHLARYSNGGYGPLKVVLAEYLRATRQIQCAPEQIMLLNGSHQAIDLCARMLCDPGDCAWIEDPGYWGARNVLRAAGLELRAAPVDAQGISLQAAPGVARPRLLFVTPSSQYPSGVVMSLARRLALLEFAEWHGSWVIEDDYDNEIRYHPHPTGALFGQSKAQRVLYLGTFSKTMFPGLRLAYLVVPEALVDAFATGNAELYREGRMIEQAALAEFIDAGHFSAHLRRVRSLYQLRRERLRRALESRLGELIHTRGGMAGLQLTYQFAGPADDRMLARVALDAGIVFRPLSIYHLDPQQASPGMVLGFAAVTPEAIDATAPRLCGILAHHLRAD